MENLTEKPIDPRGGLLTCWKCGVSFGRRRSPNEFSYQTNQGGVRTSTNVKIIPTGGIAQYKFTCNNCESGQIYVSVGENLKVDDAKTTKNKGVDK